MDRKEVNPNDCWDLSSLYITPDDWEKDFAVYQQRFPKLSEWKGRLGESLQTFNEFLDYSFTLDELEEKLFDYAQLRVSENLADSDHQGRMGRLMSQSTQKGAAESFVRPEILSMDPKVLEKWLETAQLKDYKIFLQKTLRFRPHTLSTEGENLMALGAEALQTPSKAFSNLTNTDMVFGTVTTDQGEVPLTQSTYSLFLQSPNSKVRRQAYKQFYQEFKAHENTLSALYAGSIHQDIYQARARGFKTSLDRALFPDKVDRRVYEQLISSVHEGLPTLHRYYDIKRRVLGLERLHHSDVYAPLIKDIKIRTTYDQACEKILKALAPLGPEYTQILGQGLSNGWVDRYENKGKRSGAFSSGSFKGNPYILMNFKEEDLRDVFTLAHEGGHSMHSWYSARSNPFPHYSYTIFEAEVASTFNEQLLGHHLLATETDPQVKGAILCKMTDDTVATLFRQTMFAEFELASHEAAEQGQGLTLDFFKQTYQKLLNQYFGPLVDFEADSTLEGLRIPHFYRSFYVYKYATGISAAMSLSDKVLKGDKTDLEAYLKFLKSGGSRYPAESLALAGVDVSGPEVVRRAIRVFNENLDKLESYLRL